MPGCDPTGHVSVGRRPTAIGAAVHTCSPGSSEGGRSSRADGGPTGRVPGIWRDGRLPSSARFCAGRASRKKRMGMAGRTAPTGNLIRHSGPDQACPVPDTRESRALMDFRFFRSDAAISVALYSNRYLKGTEKCAERHIVRPGTTH